MKRLEECYWQLKGVFVNAEKSKFDDACKRTIKEVLDIMAKELELHHPYEVREEKGKWVIAMKDADYIVAKFTKEGAVDAARLSNILRR